MKLMRVGKPGHEKPAVLVEGEQYVDVSDLVTDFGGEFLAPGRFGALREAVGERVENGLTSLVAEVRVGAPIARPQQIICIGLNYADHAAETGQAVPSEPIVFNKAPNTLIGPYDDVRIPRGSVKTDWEVELGVVIGQRCRYLSSEEEAISAITGYVVVNDVSEREFQLERGGQWCKGKSAETFNPCGPWLLTADEVPDALALSIWLDVNGQRRQEGSTSTMIFSPAYVVYYLSQFMVLEAGDLINTGTPPGVGMGMTPPTYLREGDVMELGIAGLGSQRQRVVSAP